jgi:outer membrane protein TolC
MIRFLFALVCIPLCHAYAQAPVTYTLQEAVRTALHANPEVRASGANVDVVRGRRWRSLSPPPPTVSGEYSFIPNGQSLASYGERRFAVSQTIDFPLAYPLRASREGSLLREGEWHDASARSAVATEVKIQYATVQSLTMKLELAKENRAVADEFLGKTQVRASLGEGTALDVLSARMLAAQATNAVENAVQDIAAARGAFLALLGQPPGAQSLDFRLTDTISVVPFSLRDDDIIDRAVHASAPVLAAEARAAAASTAVTLAWMSGLPSLSATYAWQKQSGNQKLHGIAFGISIPVWFALDQRGQIEEADAASRAATFELDALRNSIAQQASAATIALQQSGRQAQFYRNEMLPQAEQVYRVAAASWGAGDISYLELLQVRQSMIAVKSAAIDAQLDYQTARARLEGLLGITGIE